MKTNRQKKKKDCYQRTILEANVNTKEQSWKHSSNSNTLSFVTKTEVPKDKNRILKEMMNFMLIDSGAPPNLWGEAILTANSILNRIPHKKNSKTLYEMWIKLRPIHIKCGAVL